jgi:hypothetical protein
MLEFLHSKNLKNQQSQKMSEHMDNAIYPLTVPEIAEAQDDDVTIKKLSKSKG